MIEAAWFQLLAMPALIFLARVTDVSLGTIRIIFVSRHQGLLAACVGFFEVLIWLVVISQILGRLGAWYHFVAYAAGFATGNYVGILIEERLAMGTALLRLVTREDPAALLEQLNQHDIGATVMLAQGATGPVRVLLAVLRRRDLGDVLGQIRQRWPDTFYTIEDVRSVSRGIFPHHPGRKGK
ncbi:MAG TPA: DUF5698 domain-containing protein [Myxococcota bacterium]|nr:DUF5698 domain-containing protein [Myxococcota bacterium]HRY94764.1 DUF5698 domain-containing protein [Myxococcota bacterium]HSA22598.1 DUF5698 domain-containing protein [Myxococcota bacterium]